MKKSEGVLLRASLSDRLMQNKWMQATYELIESRKWQIVLVAIAFLLGRAVILESLMSFAVAYFAVIYFMRKDIAFYSGLAIVLGSTLSLKPAPLWLALELLVVYLLFRGLQAFEKVSLSKVPLIVFVSVIFVQLFHAFIGNAVDWYSLMMVFIEAALAFVLTLVFTHALPVITLTRKSAKLKSEEMICVMILLACVMTGTVGWAVQGISAEHVLSRYMLLVFAMAGGAPLGATVGVIAGLIISLADFSAVLQIGVLAFAGLLAGLLREGGKMGAAFGLLLGSSILTIYVGSQEQMFTSVWESALAALLLLLTPKAMIQAISQYVPGSVENTKSHYEYAKHIRNATASRVLHFSDMFKALSNSFYPNYVSQQELAQEEQITKFMEAVANESCANCHRQKVCWGDKLFQTRKMMSEMMSSMEADSRGMKEPPKAWQSHCIHVHEVQYAMRHQYELHQLNHKWQRQLHELKGLVADQLMGVSQVMEDLSQEIKREGQALHIQEEQIKEAVEALGLSIHSIDIINLEVGNVEIEIQHTFEQGFQECRKIIAPLLSEILGENITVRSESAVSPHNELQRAILASAKQFEVDIGVAGVAKGGDLLSGDSFSMMELDSGKFAVAISDGMGNGERARQESSAALTILQQLLQSGMNEQLAVKSVNSILLLRSPEEIYATVDLAIIDLYSANTTFLKIGSTPSFIKRGNDVIPIVASNLPIGIIQEIDVDFIHMPLQQGDLLIMMSDGIYDAPGYAVNKELWMKRVISELRSNDPQEIADNLLDTVVRFHDGAIHDDMTVLVTRLDRYVPQWATFKWPGVGKIERKKSAV